jgi:hypothetical protein
VVQIRVIAHKPLCFSFRKVLILCGRSRQQSAPHNHLFLMRESPADRPRIGCESTETLA